MKLRAIILMVTGCLVLAAGIFLPSSRRVFATPEECVRNYYESALNGADAVWLDCLAAPLRTRSRESHRDDHELRGYLRALMSDLKNWAQIGKAESGAGSASIEIEETRAGGRRRVPYRCELRAGSWQIVEIGAAAETPALIPYGTHEKDLLPKS